MEIKPIGERVLLAPVEKEEKTGGGIYLPDEARKEKKEGFIIAAGTFADGRPLPVQKGDRVIYGGYSSEELEIQGQKYLLIEFKDILAKIGGEHQ